MPQPANLDYWNGVNEFTLTEAAWLWCNQEPSDSGIIHMPRLGKGFSPHPVIPGLPAQGDRIARALWRDIKGSKLVILSGDDGYYRIPRGVLCAWAENHSEFRPRFLFPNAAEVVKNLGCTIVQPATELQARPLTRLQRMDDWAKEIIAAMERLTLRGIRPDEHVAVWAEMIAAGATKTKDRGEEALEKTGIDKPLSKTNSKKRLKAYKAQ